MVSDYFQRRATTCLFTTVLMIIGLIIMRADPGSSGMCQRPVQPDVTLLTDKLLSADGVRYLGIFFLTMGVHCNVPALLALNQSNTLGAANRAISSGVLIACGAIGGIIGSLIFRAEVRSSQSCI
jgi:uncharacterized membrane protein